MDSISLPISFNLSSIFCVSGLQLSFHQLVTLPCLRQTLQRCSGIEDTKGWSILFGILFLFLLQTHLKVCTKYVVTFFISTFPRHSLWGQVKKLPSSFLCNGSAFSCCKLYGHPWKKCGLKGSLWCTKISVFFSALMLSSQYCLLMIYLTIIFTRHNIKNKFLFTILAWQKSKHFNLCHHLDFGLVDNGLNRPLRGLKNTVSISGKRDLGYWFIWQQFTFPPGCGSSQSPLSSETLMPTCW